jgi:Transcriptional regulator PadR-like family
MLGEFEHVLITAAAGLGDKAYGAAIREEIEAATGQNCSIGGLYTTLDQLETKGLITTWMADSTPAAGPWRLLGYGAKGRRPVTSFSCSLVETTAQLLGVRQAPRGART